MSFLTPLFLALLALAVPIIVLYMLKLRRREVEVSSTLLWQMLLRDREANAPWQKLKRNLLLFVQLLLLTALVLALARPFFWVQAIATGTVVVVLDASASMRATDLVPNRFEAARVAVQQLIDGLPAESQMTLILAGHQPEVLASATSDKTVLREALSRAATFAGPANWEAALALAAGAVRLGPVDNATTVIVSDGGLPSGLPALPGEVRYLPIGRASDNLALIALALRPAEGGPQLFAKVANYGDAERSVIVSFYEGEQLFSAQQVTVAPGKTGDVILTELPEAPAVYEARLSVLGADGQAIDAFPLDDRAWTVYQPPSAGRALLVSPGNVFLEQVLTALPGLTPFRSLPGAPIPTDPFDLYVFDGVISGTLPAADLLLINPSSNALFTVGAAFTNTHSVSVRPNDPLTRYLDWDAVHILRAFETETPAWARTLVQAEGGPLVFAGEVGGRRVAVVMFDLHDSDLPLQVTYPILMANLINYLAPAENFSAPDGLRPGDTLTIRPSGGDAVIGIQDPTGARFATATTEAGVLFAETYELGVYTVLSNQSLLGSFAVNLFDPAESNIRPVDVIRVGRSDVVATVREEQGQLEIWPWVAGVAFVLLLLEWWLYQRGATLPSMPGWRGFFSRKKMAEK